MKTWKIAVLLSYISIASASAAIITPALLNIQNALGLTHGQADWLISIFLIGYMVGQILYGPLANYMGRLSALRLGFIINLIGITICLIASHDNNYSGLLAGRFITALGASAGLSCTFMLINESLSSQQAKYALSFAVVSFTVGIGLAVFLGGIITQYNQWQNCFWLLFAHGILILGSTWFFEETLMQAKDISITFVIQNYLISFRNIKLVIFSLFVGLVSAFSYCYSAAAPIIAQLNLGLTAASYGYWNTLNMMGMLLGAITASQLLKRCQDKRILFLSVGLFLITLMSLAFLSMTQHLNVILFFGISIVLYFFASIIFPAASYIASNTINNKANASSAMNFINMAAAMAGVILQGYLPVSRITAFVMINLGFGSLCLLLWLFNQSKTQ